MDKKLRKGNTYIKNYRDYYLDTRKPFLKSDVFKIKRDINGAILKNFVSLKKKKKSSKIILLRSKLFAHFLFSRFT